MRKLAQYLGTLCALLICELASAESNSSFNVESGILSVPCVDVLNNGEPAGEGGSRLSYTLSMTLVDGRLVAGDVTEVNAEGECSASFDSATGIYTDLVSLDQDQVELRLSYAGGVDFVPDAVFFQRNFITEDLSAVVGMTTLLPIVNDIDTSIANLILEDGSAVPDFITLQGSELQVSPTDVDIGSYALRIQWGDQVEFININVLQASSDIVALDQLPPSLPSFLALNLYAADSVFNQPLPETVVVDPDSTDLLEGLQISEQFVVQVGQFSSTVFFAGNSTPIHDVSLPCGEFWELGINFLTSVPIPEWATPANDVDGGDEPPVDCGEDSAQDNFMTILDLDNRCEYNLWQSRREDGQWVASFGTAFDMDGSGIHPNGLSSRGSGMSFLGGVIWPSELAAGEITHPLSFSYEFSKAGGPVSPATDSDGISTESFALPEGARIQLDPDFDLSSLNLTDYEMTIARAMQVYGLLLVDSGGAGPVGLYAVDPDSASTNDYADIWGEDDFITLANLQIAELPFRVLELSDQNDDYQQNLQLADNRCAAYQ